MGWLTGDRYMDHLAVIGAGGNLGDREGALRQGVRAVLQLPGTHALKISSIYETEPWGLAEQPPYLNLVFSLNTSLAPRLLLKALHFIEASQGRVRRKRWGARHLDLDLLLYDSLVSDTPELTLPHPGMAQRNFVLVPLREIHPDLIDPSSGATIAQLCERCADDKAVNLLGSLSGF